MLGKIVGGGLPLGGVRRARATLMEQLAPVGRRLPGGTLSGNPLATAAGLSVLRRLRDPAVYDELERKARAARGRPCRRSERVQRVGVDADAVCGIGSRCDFDDAQRCDTERYGALFRHLLDAGVYVAPSQFEAMFVSLAHGDEEIDRTVEAVGDFFVADALGRDRGRGADRESPLWERLLCGRSAAREREAVFSPLGDERLALGLETIYEGYLLHYGRPRLFAPPDGDNALLLGDYLYAHGLVRIAAPGEVDAVADLAELISLCAQLRAERADGDDGAAWAATAALLGDGRLEAGRDALRRDGDAASAARAGAAKLSASDAVDCLP